jgi:polysaccharide biosynthesis protein PslG
MDGAIPTLNQNGFKVLASIVTAPAHLRLLPGVNGPPDNFDDYALFVQTFLKRYPGMVQSVEVWNEPNLSAEWDWQIDGAVYRHLLAAAYITIKAVDPSIMVISGALAPTSTGSVWTHVDDHSFIAKFRRYNGDAYTDCVGAHANGPDGIGNIDRVASNYFHWFDQSKPICVTEFGYGLPVQGQAPAGFAWIMHHTVAEQVSTLTRGFAWARSSGYVRFVIVWNLDYWGSPSDPNAPYALIRLGWESPAIAAIAQLSNEQQQK